MLPIRSVQPEQLCRRLRQAGYDATRRGSQMRVLSPPSEHPEWTAPLATEWIPQLVFLPLHPALRPHDAQRLAAIVADHERQLAAAAV